MRINDSVIAGLDYHAASTELWLQRFY